MAFLGIIAYLTLFLLNVNMWQEPYFPGVPILENIIVITGFLLLPRVFDGRLGRLLINSQTICFIIFIIFSILSLYYMGFSYAISTTGYIYLQYFCTFVVFVLALDSLRKVKLVFLVLISLGIFIGICGINQYITGIDIITGQTLNWRGGIQWVGYFGGSDISALLYVVLLGYSLGFWLLSETIWLKLLGFASSGLFILDIILTGSRGGFVGLLFVIMSYIYIKFSKKIKLKTFIPIALALIITIMFVKPHEQGRGLRDSTSSERIEIVYQGIQMFKDHPFLGVGSGTYFRHNSKRKAAHNIFLQHISETGFIGGTAFLLMCAISIAGLIKTNKNFTSKEDYMVGIQTLTGFIGFLSCAFFLSVLNIFPYLQLAFCTAIPFSQGYNNKMRSKHILYASAGSLVLLFILHMLVRIY